MSDPWFLQDCFAEFARRQELRDLYFTTQQEARPGIVQCNKCGSNRTIAVERQTRACDEGTTVFVFCTHCKQKFKLAG